MNYSDTRFTLDVQLHQAQVSVSATLNDTARRLCVGFTDGRKPYVIAEGCTATFAAKKPDGLALFNACSIENNTIIYEFTPQTTNVIGTYECEIRLYNEDGKQLTSPRFLLVVDEQAINDDDVIDSFTEVTMLNQIIANESERIVKENERIETETERIAAEKKRAQEEYGNPDYRYDPEQGRVVDFEGIAVEESMLGGRAGNERTRQANEEERKKEEIFRANCEASRDLSEDERDTNENTRRASEQERALQEYGNGYWRYDPDKGCVVDAWGEAISEEMLGGRVGNERTRQAKEGERIVKENERIANEDTRISNENTRISNENQRLAKDSDRETRLANVETKVNNLVTETNSLSSRTSAVELKTNGLEMDIVNHTNSISSLQTNVQTIDTNMGALGERVGKNETNISNLNFSVQDNSQDIQTNAQNIQKNDDQIGYINNYLRRSPSESENIFLDVYPIGSIYMSVNPTSPASLFGGTWEQLKDRFLLGASNTYSSGSSGGTSVHKHDGGSLTALMTMNGNNTNQYFVATRTHYNSEGVYASWDVQRLLNFSSTGSPTTNQEKYGYTGLGVDGQTGSGGSLPPYLAVYMWKRTA